MAQDILVLAGSARRDSVNRRLAAVAAATLRARGTPATLLELADYPLPLYHGDLEASEGLPDNARRLKDIFLAHGALVIVTPEYNSSLPALLKNTVDWVSRPLPEQSGYLPFAGKAAALMSASPGALGGLRALRHLRDVLTELQMIVLPRQLSLPAADKAFDDAGALRDTAMATRLATLLDDLVAMRQRLT